MKAGMILGIIGGVIALFVGAAGYQAASIGNQVMGLGGRDDYFDFQKFASIGLPIVALIGAGIVPRNPMLAGITMGVSAIAMLGVFGVNLLSLVPVALLGVGAVLVINEHLNPKQPSSPGS